jgi:2-polyprenyl-3-methyl-5-hydroxy-6-metoxy-1,4-benzoquinol methylase
MFTLIRRGTKRILLIMHDRLSTNQLEDLIEKTITHRANALPPDQALSFLLRLDARLYVLEGTKATEYGGGLHTKHRHTRYHEFFIARVRPGERVLDVGCGNGAVAYDLAKRAEAEVVGIELLPENIAQAQTCYQHPRVRFMVGDALKSLPDEHFDVVILSNVLEHLKARPSFLRRLQEKVNPSRFLIRVPLYERDWRVPLKCELGVEWRLDPTHETEYTLESFAEEMRAANLKITHQEVRWGEIWTEAVPNV